MSLLKQVIDGHYNEVKSLMGVGDEKVERMSEIRASICNVCPLKNGNTCSTNKYIHPETKDVSLTPKPGYKKGCGCRLSAKQKSRNSECPAKFWEKY